MSGRSPPRPAPLAAALAFLEEARRQVEADLERVLEPARLGPGRLGEAMRYSVLAGGKRLRPALALASARAVGGEAGAALAFGTALELVHTYSLIHDDLPAMDDDDLRRGRPTSHVVFGEAMAILAGDALHTLAFSQLLARVPDAALARDLAVLLAEASGPDGMVGGQVDDLTAAGQTPSLERLERIQARKTGALIRAACEGGARAGGATPAEREALARYGRHLGIAFQVVDDILDVTGTAEALGKTPGKDESEQRMTWVALAGLEGARARADREVGQALEAIDGLPGAELLRGLAAFVTRRDR
jgi:geranylgeranyl diphosphate synthase type II